MNSSAEPKPVTPKANDQDVIYWLKLHGFTGTPDLIRYEEHGYQPRFCHISAKHHASTNGGKRVHGWALWRWRVPETPIGTTVIFAEHHSVWQTPDGALVDLTPPASGGTEVLFLRDDSAPIIVENGQFLMHTDRTDHPDHPRVFRGQPTEYEYYPLDPQKPDLLTYANHLGFDVGRMATDPQHG